MNTFRIVYLTAPVVLRYSHYDTEHESLSVRTPLGILMQMIMTINLKITPLRFIMDYEPLCVWFSKETLHSATINRSIDCPPYTPLIFCHSEGSSSYRAPVYSPGGRHQTMYYARSAVGKLHIATKTRGHPLTTSPRHPTCEEGKLGTSGSNCEATGSERRDSKWVVVHTYLEHNTQVLQGRYIAHDHARDLAGGTLAASQI